MAAAEQPARSSLLKTARPFRGSPHRRGKGAAVFGRELKEVKEVKEIKDFASGNAETSATRKMCGRTRDSCGHRGAVEEFDDVEDFVVGAVDGGAGAELEEAAGVGGDDGLGAGGLGVAHFIGE